MLTTNFKLQIQQAGLASEFDTPTKIQEFLDSIPYSIEDRNRCPMSVLSDRQAHCLDGALFAAAGLRQIGYPPLVIDLQPEPGMDDDHVLAIFKQNGAWGALAKSNFAALRYREPVYRTVRELVMSYFENYVSLYRLRVLRYYTRPYDLSHLDKENWVGSDTGADEVEKKLWRLHRVPLLTREQAEALLPVDERSYQAAFLGVNIDGVFKPKAQAGKI